MKKKLNICDPNTSSYKHFNNTFPINYAFVSIENERSLYIANKEENTTVSANKGKFLIYYLLNIIIL